MPQGQNKRSTIPPTILIVIAAVLLIGVGRCGFLQPQIRPAYDYGISGACCVVLGLALLITGFMWLGSRRKRS